jgi:uncharacterized protein (DUF1330 family)
MRAKQDNAPRTQVFGGEEEGHHENSVHGRIVNDCRSRSWWRGHCEAAWQDFVKAVRASQQTASGRNLRTARGKVVALVGAPPKNVGITEFDSLDQAVGWRNSQAWKDLDPQRNKAIKIVRQYTVEAEN